ncbi:hypothetical protein V8C86DRAFT_2642987 [Haematococcus lacustris]
MSITRQDLIKASFTSTLDDVQELTLDNQGIADLGCISELPHLTSLTLAFNNLSSSSALSSLSALQHLNLSHNHLTALTCRSLPALTHLNASHNRLRSLKGLAACPSLTTAFLQHNQLTAAELQHLSSLTRLQRLCLAPNPLTREVGGQQQYRALLAGLCPALEILDGQPISASEREAAQLRPLTPTPPCWPHSTPTPPAAPLASLGSTWGEDLTGGEPGGGVGGGAGGACPPLRAVRGRQRHSAPSSCSAPLTLAEEVGSAGLAAPPGGRRGRLPAGLHRHHSSQALGQQQQQQQEFEWLGSSSAGDHSSARTSLPPLPSSARSSQGQHRARPPAPGPGRPPPAARLRQLPADSSFNAVLAALPVFNPGKLPGSYAPSQLAGSWARKPAPAQPPPDAGTVDFELRYAGGARCMAARVRRDGSACASWPNSDLAVTVDSDWGNAGGNGSGRAEGVGRAEPGGVGAPGPAYRLYAAYRTGGSVAVSWDAGGGFVQYPNGNVAIRYSNRDGVCYSPSSQVLLRWSDPPQPARRPTGASAPGFRPGTGRDAPSTSDSGQQTGPHCSSDLGSQSVSSRLEPPYVDMALDCHFGVRFNRALQQLQLYMSCEGVRYMYKCGYNKPGAGVWSPPYKQSEPGTSGICDAKGVSLDVAVPSTAPSHPAFAGEEVMDDEPPAFLRQLADGSTAGPQRARMVDMMMQQQAKGSEAAAGFPSMSAFSGIDSLAGLTAALSALQSRMTLIGQASS